MQAREKVIEFSQVTKSYRSFQALKGINLDVYRGEFLGLLGPNGAGKTTLVEILQGLRQPDQGSVKVLGKYWHTDTRWLRRRVSGVLQEPLFINKLTVQETFALFTSFYRCSRKRMHQVMEMVELGEKRKTYVEGLSGGQKQRLALGVAIINEPEIMILDEPTTGLDPRIRHETWEILHRLNREHHATMLLTTHYMQEAEFLCDRICIINRGEILTLGTMDELLKKHCVGEVIEFRVHQSEPLASLAEHPDVIHCQYDRSVQRMTLVTVNATQFMSELMSFTHRHHIHLDDLLVRKKTLDDLFMNIASGALHE